MDHFKWTNGQPLPNEEKIHEQIEVTIYTGSQRSAFEAGKLVLTSHRLLWYHKSDHLCIVELRLNQIFTVELQTAQQQSRNAMVYPKIILYLDKSMRPQSAISPPLSSYNEAGDAMPFVQYEFGFGGHNEFLHQLNQQLVRKKWEYGASTGGAQARPLSSSTLSSQMQSVGIGGIQSRQQDRLDKQDQIIQESFKDLSVLMDQAKEMVKLSNILADKLAKEAGKTSSEAGGGAESEDSEDMKKIKGYFLSMGLIDNPVTKESSGSSYHKDLAMEIYKSMTPIVVEQGGIMSLADVYCRLNRARGIAGLISADDLLIACKCINKLALKLKYNVYAGLNLHVLEIESQSKEANEKVHKTYELVVKNENGLSAYGLSQMLNCSLLVAKKHLLDGERVGKLCRDDTSSGLKFFPNYFLSPPPPSSNQDVQI